MLVFDQNSSSCSCVAAVTRRHFSEELDLYSFALLLLSHGLRRCLCEGSGSVDITFGLILCNSETKALTICSLSETEDRNLG